MKEMFIPENTKGKPSDLEFSVILPSVEEAQEAYKRAVKRMQNPPIWHELAGWASASFALRGLKGEALHRLAWEGDYIRIDVAGPGPAAGGGYDWVRVERMEEYTDQEGQVEWTGMTLRPGIDPTDAEHMDAGEDRGDTAHAGADRAGAAHFFQHEATSTFVIERVGIKVNAYYHGRNEVPNTATEKTTDNIRNAVVAAGAIARLSEAQWSALSKGFLTDEIGG